MGLFAVAVIVIAAGLLIGAVLFGFLRNNRAAGAQTSGADADLTTRRR